MKNIYSEGKDEDYLLRYFKNGQKQSDAKAVSDWSFKYHTDPSRGNIISWFNFEPGSRVLEVGAGTGVISEVLLKKDIKLTTIEMSHKRSEISRERNKKFSNIEILTADIQKYKPEELFDYIVCIGVLEYAGSFINEENPYEAILAILNSFLTPTGRLLLAIENRFGLKYWSGSKEDHTGNFFDSINDYPLSNKVKTFGKLELENILISSGFNSCYFYYPYPDYKLPQILFSDDYYPGDGRCLFPIHILPTSAPDRTRIELFSEASAMIQIEKNNLFREFSNSFFVIASKKNRDLHNQNIYSVFSMKRKDEFTITTSISHSKDGSLMVEKSGGLKTKNHLQKMYRSAETIQKTLDIPSTNIVAPLGRSVISNNNNYTVKFPFIDGYNLERYLIDNILADNREIVLELLDDYLLKLHNISVQLKPTQEDQQNFKSMFGVNYPENFSKYFLSPGNLDINLDNILVDNAGTWHLIDYEWVFDFPVPKDYVLGRALWWFFGVRYRSTLLWHSEKLSLVGLGDILVIPKYIIDRYSALFANMGTITELEECFQAYAVKESKPFPIEWKKLEKKIVQKSLGYIDQQEIDIAKKTKELSELLLNYNQLRSDYDALTIELNTIKNSRGYRALEKVRKIKGIAT